MNPTTKQITHQIKKESLSHTNLSFNINLRLRSLASLVALRTKNKRTNREVLEKNRHSEEEYVHIIFKIVIFSKR